VTRRVLVTGSAGFIGFHLVKALLEKGFDVVGLDNLNDYYDSKLKLDRLENIEEFLKGCCSSVSYDFVNMDIADDVAMDRLFEDFQFYIVVNLAAQAGVRYSIENPKAYIDSNLVGFSNVLECCRRAKVEHLLFASSSSVYGMNTKQPFSVSDNTDFPISLYAATKKSNELLAHSYSHLFSIPCTGLRFFTVYGPYGRPDMAYYKFTKAILEGELIDVFNNGEMRRDFTYIDDIVSAIILLLSKPPELGKSKTSAALARFKIYNIGNNSPVDLSRFISAIEISTGMRAKKNHLPMQAGDVRVTFADVDDLIADIGFRPETSIEEGIDKFVTWYKGYMKGH